MDRRFALPAIGSLLVLGGVAVGAAFIVGDGVPRVLASVLATVLLLYAAVIALIPPVVARVGSASLRVGGRMTVRPVVVAWDQVENVSTDGARLFVERLDAGTLAVPLAYFGRRRTEFVREVYDRLNDANGYRRFDPS